MRVKALLMPFGMLGAPASAAVPRAMTASMSRDIVALADRTPHAPQRSELVIWSFFKDL